MARVFSLLLFLLGAFFGAEAARTYIANAYPEPIFAMVDADRAKLTKAEKDVNANFNINAGGFGFGVGGGQGEKKDWNVYHIASSSGYTAIKTGQEIYYEPKHDGTVYISIFIKEDDKVRYITKGHDLTAGSSVIVSKDGFLRNTEAGGIWKDAQGFNHYHKSFVCLSDSRIHIANAYPFTIFVMAGLDNKKLENNGFLETLRKVGPVRDGAEVALYPVTEQFGFTMIEPMNAHCFDFKNDGMVWVATYVNAPGDPALTISMWKAGTSNILIRNSNTNIAKRAVWRTAKEGKLWTDKNGTNYNPAAEPNDP